MNQKIMKKILPLVLIVLLIQINFYGLNFGSSSDSPQIRGPQPYNSFRNYIWGGLGEQTDNNYGWNLTYIENLNGDAYPDLVIGTPWYYSGSIKDIGRVYIFYGKANIGFNNINCSKADVTITGDAVGNKFGWSVADAGDMNNDGINDLIVGAPGVLNNRGRAYIFYGGGIPGGSSTAFSIVDRILEGIATDGYYGSAVAGVGDLNGDNYDDVAVGAPGADHVIITYGYKNKMILYPNLWDDDETTKGVVKFDKGCNNGITDDNTWGLGMGDDGWDWIDSYHDPTLLYGQTSPAPATDHATIYAPWEDYGPDADGLTLSNRSSLEVMVGRNHTDYNPYGLDSDWVDDPEASAAWGIEFNITPEQWSYISGNSSISLGFDYSVVNANWVYNRANTTRWHTYAIRSRIWNSTTSDYLGDIVVNNEKYIYNYREGWNTPCWSPVYDSYQADITNYIDGSGTYYWDFGCFLNFYTRSQGDDGMMAFFDNITMKISNERSVIIVGSEKSGFGTSIASVGDIDNDGYPDTLIGAPYLDGGYAGLLPGKKKYKEIDSINLANIILTGKNHGDRFGYSISSAGDVDNDGKTDVIIGAPGGNYANLYYGSTLNLPLLVPDLWERDQEKGTPQIEFDTGVKTTGNTPGLAAADDGWDTWNGVYGFESGETPGSAVTYNGINGISTQEIADDDELIVYIGGTLGGGGWGSATPDSGAYGVKFSVSQDMIDAIEAGGDAVLSYDWRFENFELDQDDTIWIKTFIRGDTDTALGWGLDNNAVDNNNKDSTNETYWADIPEDINNAFVQECSECFSTQGSYYLDIGAKLRNYDWIGGGLYEDGGFHFDNVYLRINPPPDVKFIGPAESSFGNSVTYSNKLNIDDYSDIIIGAPYYDLPSGNDSGAIFGFLMEPSSDKIRFAEAAEFVNYGEHAGDNFGWILRGELSLDADDFTEIITSAINYGSNDVGKVYLFSITKIPRIRLIHPKGGEVLSGNVTVNATVSDPDDNIDNTFGVRFSYSTDLSKWTVIGDDTTPFSIANIYEHVWDTSELPDGANYYIKAWVRDLELNNAENISSAISVDNPHRPEISIMDPKNSEVVSGVVEIKVKAKDSELDNIGGGINTTKGVQFYFSDNQVDWELLGTESTGTQDVYSRLLDTEEYLDGEYWVRVEATDFDGFDVEEKIKIYIDNPGRPPTIKLLEPMGVQEVSGVVKVRATAFDMDKDINSSGVTFYISTEDSPEDWQAIGNVSVYELNLTGAHIYSMEWDTKTVPDNWYRLKAFVMDNENLTNESAISEFKVHNSVENPPTIKIMTPLGGEIVKETQMITARVRDLDNNIDSHGVDYYYSEDKDQWRYIGTTAKPRTTDEQYYDFLWQTNTVPDGEYWLNVSVSDKTQLKSWYVLDDPIFIHNSRMNPPFIRILAPSRGQHINGTFAIQASAIDLENNINTMGVVFMYSTDREDWNVLVNVPAPLDADRNIYEYSWDTTKHKDGRYWIKADATDFDGLKGSGISDYFFIHNNLNNAPKVTLLSPNSGEVSGTIKINATAFDLENNINIDGIKFYYSRNNESWQTISNDPSGSPIEEERFYYEIMWDTTVVPDDIYWLRAEAKDFTDLIGWDISDDSIIVHNKLTNPPRIYFKTPQMGLPLDPQQSIIVEVIDFENDVDRVSFYYSTDNKTWVLIDSRLKPERGNTYKTVWGTGELYNGDYHIRVIASDKMGNQEEVIEGPFELTVGRKKSDDSTSGGLRGSLIWIIIIIVIIIIMALIILMILKRSKRREKELIEEVSAELRGAQTIDGEIVSEPGRGMGTPGQTYIPSSEAKEIAEGEGDIEDYRDQMDAWRAEGFLVTRLENLYFTDRNMFMKAFPIFKTNVAKLKTISSKLNDMDTTDYEMETDNIRQKLFDPDQAMAAENEFNDLLSKMGIAPAPAAVSLPKPTTPSGPGLTPELPPIDDMLPQLLPADTSAVEIGQAQAPQVDVQLPDDQTPPDADAPPDIELPPDLDLPPEEPKEPVTPTAEGATTENEAEKKPETKNENE